MIKIEKLSIKQLTIGVIVLFGLSSIVISFFASTYFLNSALKYQYHSFARVIQIGSQESVSQLRATLLKVASNLASNRSLTKLMSSALEKKNQMAMKGILDDTLQNGFVGVAQINLVAIRLFTTELKPITKSQLDAIPMNGGQTSEQWLPNELPKIIQLKAANRNPVEQLKAIFDFWRFKGRPYYSVMLPIGGFNVKGYMELVVDPVFNLRRLANILHMPIKILSHKEETLFQSGISSETLINMHPIEYELQSSLYETIVKIIAYTDAESLKKELIEAQAYTSMFFLGLTLFSLLIALWIFNRYLFEPLSKMVSQIKLITQGNLQTNVAPFGLKEFSLLATNFNIMTAQLHERTKILDHLSKNDALTGIANRRYFQETFEREFYRARRNGQPLGLLVLDIDYFKKYNDSYGHQQGDICLQNVAQAISQVLVRPSDFVARYGGEEFVIVLPDTAKEGVFHIGEQIRTDVLALKLNHQASSVCKFVTVSIGGRVFCQNNYNNPDDFLKSADDLLYMAKSKNRNRVIVENMQSLENPLTKQNIAVSC